MTISKFSGISPVSTVQQGSGPKVHKVSKLWLVYSACVMVLQVTVEVFLAYKQLNSREEFILAKATYVTYKMFACFALCIQVASLCGSKRLAEILNALLVVNSFHNGNELKSAGVRNFSMVLIFLSVTMSLFVMNSVSKVHSRGLTFTLIATLRFTLTILPYFLLIHFVTVIRTKFEHLNSRLEPKNLRFSGEIKSTHFPTISFKTHPVIKSKKKTTSRSVAVRSNNETTSRSVAVRSNNETTSGSVVELSRNHHQLCELAEQLHVTFSAQITMALATGFLQFTMCSYIALRFVLVSAVNKLSAVFKTGITLQGSLVASEVAVLLWFCKMAASEVRGQNLGIFI